jgi:hypothetical protein
MSRIAETKLNGTVNKKNGSGASATSSELF